MADDDETKPSEKDDDETKGTSKGPSADEFAKVQAALKKANKEAEASRLKLKEIEDRDLSDNEKLTARVAELEKELYEANGRAVRMEVAAAKGLTAAQAKRLVGTTSEELEADADELLSTFKPATEGDPGEGDDGDDSKGGDGDKPAPPTGRPTPDLKGGGDPTTQDSGAVDLRKVVADIPRF